MPQPRKTAAIGSVLGAMSLVVLDAGMANVALPTMAHDLDATAANAVLVITVQVVLLRVGAIAVSDLARGHRLCGRASRAWHDSTGRRATDRRTDRVSGSRAGA